MSQRPHKFCPETKKDTAFFIIERLEVSKGSNHSDLTLLSPLAFLLKVFRPTRTQDHIGLPRELKFQLTFSNVNPSAHANHTIQLSWHHHSTWQNRKTWRQHIHFSQWLLQEFLQITTILLCMIDPVNSMDYCSSLKFPKMGVLFFEMQANKT